MFLPEVWQGHRIQEKVFGWKNKNIVKGFKKVF